MARVYTLPVFLSTAVGWSLSDGPSIDSPDLGPVPCQFYVESRQPGAYATLENDDPIMPIMIIRIPYEYDAFVSAARVIGVESTRALLYRPIWKTEMHFGFTNCYWAIGVVQCNDLGTPTPVDVEVYPPPG